MMIAENKKNLVEAAVGWNRRAGAGYRRMGIQCPHIFQTALPGQFVMIRPKLQVHPLLRRPFSIHDLLQENGRVFGFELLFKVIGAGTEKLAMCQPGDSVDVLGPLGSGFSILNGAGSVYMAAGGIGVAPFVFLSKVLLQSGVDPSRITLFLGGRSIHDLLCQKTFKTMGLQVCTATDDGSAGEKGLVTALLEKAVRMKKPDILYACGPVPMLKAVKALSAGHDLRCEISIETMMACGMGACLGCAVESRAAEKKYLHACIDGPVFAAEDIHLE
jgi:dihydroorotate dehydrogenase electron transfer subunit